MKRDYFMAKSMAKKNNITFNEAYRRVKIYRYYKQKKEDGNV